VTAGRSSLPHKNRHVAVGAPSSPRRTARPLSEDCKVLLVDISGLPAQFGSPPYTRADIAVKVAPTIMGCWTGA